jgi:hypothetical protein
MLQQVKDYIDRSGSGGLLTALVEFGLAQQVCLLRQLVCFFFLPPSLLCVPVEQLYDLLLEMNSRNAVANATGQDELKGHYESLVTCAASESDSNNGVGADVLDDSQELDGLQRATLIATPHQSRRRRSLELTAAERALDEDTPPASPTNDTVFTLPPPLDFTGGRCLPIYGYRFSG